MARKFFLWLCVALISAGCASARGVSSIISSGDRYAMQNPLEDYKLGVGDKIRLTVYNEPTLSGEFTVAGNGTLSLPFVGQIPVTGKGAGEVGDLVQAKLADGYLRNPKVSAEIIGYRPFFILGEVKAPGQYPYANSLTVLNAIATAQGFTPRSDRKVAYIRRAGSSDEQAFRLTPDLRVLPGDTVRVGERYF